MTASGQPPRFRLPPIEAIRAFEAASRLGSFERAGEELAITASAIGKRVAKLEQFVGSRLLERQRGRLSLTAAGLEYLEQLRQALSLLSTVTLHQRQRSRSRLLKICAPPTFAREIIVPNLAELKRMHSDIEVDIVLSVPYLGLRPPGAHVDILADKTPDPREEILSGESMQAVCTAVYAASVGLQEPSDLQRASLIRCPLEPWSQWFAAAGLTCSEPAAGPRLVDMGMAISAAVGSLGVALIRPSLGRRWLESGELVAPFSVSSPPLTRYKLQINCGPDSPDDPGDAPQIFADWLRGLCASVTARG